MSYHNQLDQERADKRFRGNLLIAQLMVFTIVAVLLYRKADNLNVHVAKDLRGSEVVAVRDGKSSIPPANVYSFGFYVWQQVNRWKTDGGKDYGEQVFAMQNFVTPRCKQWLETNMNQKAQSGELNQRTRSLMEWPGRGFLASRVIAQGGSDDSWTVLLDLQLLETMKGQVVKDVAVRWPVPVVRYAIDLQRNPYGLAVDCNAETMPGRLEIGDRTPLGAGELDSAAKRLQPLPLPSAPASTPEE